MSRRYQRGRRWRCHHFYGDDFKAECPTGSGEFMTLGEVSQELARRVANIFSPDENGRRPCHGNDARWTNDPHWQNWYCSTNTSTERLAKDLARVTKPVGPPW